MPESRYFEAPDAYGEPTIWERSPAQPDYPQPVLAKYDVRFGHRDDLWPLIVRAVTNA